MPQTRAASRRVSVWPRTIDNVRELIADDGNRIDIPQGECRNIIFMFDAGFKLDLTRLCSTYPPRTAHYLSKEKCVMFCPVDQCQCQFLLFGNGKVLCCMMTSLDDIDALWQWLYTRVLQAFKHE